MRRLDRKNSSDVFEQMQRMFEEMTEMGRDLVPGGNMPVDIHEEEDEIVVTADMPGVNKEDISLKADPEGLEITAEGHQEIKEENEKYIRRERSQKVFRRKIQWPTEVDTDSVEASYSDGVLEVRAEKDEPEGTDIEIE